MDPTVLGAVIGAGSTAIVATVGFLSTRSATVRTVRADTDRRVWEKQTAAYELTLSELQRMQTARLIGQFSLLTPTGQMRAEYLAQRQSPSWIQAQAMLLAYAPQVVHDALDESTACYVKLATLIDQIEGLHHPRRDEPTDSDTRIAHVHELFADLTAVAVEADGKDQALANTIRAQLGLSPVRLSLPSRPALPQRQRWSLARVFRLKAGR